jgi:Flp pilus assembly protein TadD
VDALREITIARRLAPEDLDAANTNAIICVEVGDLITARDIWSSLVSLSPNYSPASANLSILNRLHAFKSQSVEFAGNVKPGHLSN